MVTITLQIGKSFKLAIKVTASMVLALITMLL